VSLDLTECRGVRLRVLCRDVSVLSNLTLYFQVEGGWYGVNFNPDAAGQWCTVDLEKSCAIPEGAPAGWDRVTALRFSAWRGSDENTEILLADLVLLDANAPVVVLGASGPDRSMTACTQLLRELGVPWLDVREADLLDRHLVGRAVLVLPPKLGRAEQTCGLAANFVKSGGRILALNTNPDTLKPVMGAVRPRREPAGASGGANLLESEAGIILNSPLASFEPSARPALVAALLARLSPVVGRAVSDGAIGAVGRLKPGSTCEDAVAAITRLADQVPARRAAIETLLGETAKTVSEARRLQASGKWADAAAAAMRAHDTMVQSYCLAQPAATGEFRAFWCHSALGVEGLTWDESARILAANGFTAVLPNMLWGGIAYYRSEVLPVWPEVSARGDPLQACLAACRKHGLQCHVWKVNWNMDGRAPRPFGEQLKRAGRTQVDFTGRASDQWLCPSHPENRRLEIEAMLEVATRYDVDGIHFDYIRYPGPDGCFCGGCRERFEKALGRPVSRWPADTRADAEVRDRWLEWRRQNITAVVAGVSERLRPVRPGVRLSAAVFRNWPVDRDSIGQDWKLWCDRGYLDFVCPMDYTPNTAQFHDMVRHQAVWAGRVPCYPGIGLSVWPERNDICRLIDQIAVTRELKTGGFVVFNYAEPEARVILPLLGKGTTRRD
jgi:uncharacterized lipoprotein YddW (UPF0748 family)